MTKCDRNRARLNKLAHLLGWGDLYVEQHKLPPEIVAATGRRVVRSYMYGDPGEVLFQINELPRWQAAVYAIRYRICTGWHNFELGDEKTSRKEAERLRDILAADWFLDRQKRREYRQRHPQYAGYTWRRLREEGPPGGAKARFGVR